MSASIIAKRNCSTPVLPVFEEAVEAEAAAVAEQKSVKAAVSGRVRARLNSDLALWANNFGTDIRAGANQRNTALQEFKDAAEELAGTYPDHC